MAELDKVLFIFWGSLKSRAAKKMVNIFDHSHMLLASYFLVAG
jgi:hypothetical protein